MKNRLFGNMKGLASGFVLAVTVFSPASYSASPETLTPAKMAKVGSVSERFQSFNIEVTGGRFWAPYKSGPDTGSTPAASQAKGPGGMDPSLYRYRPPVDLAKPQLRKLAAALGPSFVRVSGTWANTTYFQDSDAPAPATAQKGFGGVLTRKEWKGVVDFSHAVNAEVVTSFAVSAGVRDANGVWTPVEAKKLLAYTKSIGGKIAGAAMFNEPNFLAGGGVPKGYDAAAYGRDFRVFDAFVKKAAPSMLVLGPSGVADTNMLGGGAAAMKLVKSEDLLKAEGPGLDVFTYHFYGGVSKRCAQLGAKALTTPEAALSKDWLFRTAHDEEFYAKLRDQYAPGKPLWLTETGETACGGNPWASDFLDSFRYLNQLGVLAKRGVQVVMHNTLDASDYALIDESSLMPRPNYWSALLWRKLMGTTVLDAGAAGSEEPGTPNLYVYAHCLRGHPGGVAMLAINADKKASMEITLPAEADRYTLSAADLMDKKVELNGRELKVSAGAICLRSWAGRRKRGALS